MKILSRITIIAFILFSLAPALRASQAGDSPQTQNEESETSSTSPIRASDLAKDGLLPAEDNIFRFRNGTLPLNAAGVLALATQLRPEHGPQAQMLEIEVRKLQARERSAAHWGQSVGGLGALSVLAGVTVLQNRDNGITKPNLAAVGLGMAAALFGYIYYERHSPHTDDYYMLLERFQSRNPNLGIHLSLHSDGLNNNPTHPGLTAQFNF